MTSVHSDICSDEYRRWILIIFVILLDCAIDWYGEHNLEKVILLCDLKNLAEDLLYNTLNTKF